MIILLNLIMLISISAVFFLTGYYFYNLYLFKKYICTENVNLWIKEKSMARPFESPFQSAYRLFKKVDGNKIDGVILSVRLVKICAKLKIIIYSDLILFLFLLASGILLTLIDPMK